MQNFATKRCYKPVDFGKVAKAEIHHFSDASFKGYGQCSYLRLVNEDGQIHCSFVIGKARVTPLKSVTVPRLELTAAVLSVRISEQLKRELDIEITDEVFWTDSRVVLGYIANSVRHFHVFVANRVQEIQDKSSVRQWKYVDTKSNPADEASRGIRPNELTKSKWILGPDFLWKPEAEWDATLRQPVGDVDLVEDDQERGQERGQESLVARNCCHAILANISRSISILLRLESRQEGYRVVSPIWAHAKK